MEKYMQTAILQAIITKYIGPSNVRGSRIKAFCPGGSITIGYDHSLNSEECHRKAAEALRDRMKWTGELIQGGLPTGYAFTFAPPAQKSTRNDRTRAKIEKTRTLLNDLGVSLEGPENDDNAQACFDAVELLRELLAVTA